MVIKGAAMHRTELAKNWKRAREHKSLRKIVPLK